MKHFSAHSLRTMFSLLESLRTILGISELTPGSLYRKSQVFLHFHDDQARPFADLKLDLEYFTSLLSG
jgi:hypothetical protein